MHYYTNNINAQSDEQKFEYTLKGNKFQFITDIGVFSKTSIDFGSRLLIETFSVSDVAGDILDVGCGYGPIGLSLAKLSENRIVHMVDVNQRALELAQRNAKLNEIDNVKIYQSFCYDEVKEKFAAILSNPPIRAGKQVVHTIIEGAKEQLLDDGELWIVIQKKQGAPSAQKKMLDVYGNCEVVEKKKGYFILMSKKS